jgi:hypothetical protein
MTLSSKLIHAGLGLATHTLAFVGTAIAVGIGYALGSLGHARAMKRAAGQRIREVIEPEPVTVEDLVRRVVDEREHVGAIIVIEDSTERAAANDQRWN